MRRRIVNWHQVNNSLGQPAWLAVMECGHLWQVEGVQPTQLPVASDCGVCAAEAAGEPKPHTVASPEGT